MDDPSPFVPGTHGVLDGWCGPYEWRWTRGDRWLNWPASTPTTREGIEHRLSTLRPESRDRLSRWLASVLGVPVGATAPGWAYEPARRWWCLTGATGMSTAFMAATDMPSRDWRVVVPSLSSIPLDSPTRDQDALGAVCRWAQGEIDAGRLEVHHA